MNLEFLSDEWFARVREIRAEAGDVAVPAELDGLVINITATDKGGDRQLALVGGMLEPGHRENAPTTMTLPVKLARRLFVEGDKSVGVQGFMTGKIRVEGDFARLMALQSVQPSDEHKQILKRIQAITA